MPTNQGGAPSTPTTDTVRDLHAELAWIADELDSQAAISSRYGQTLQLETIAQRLRRIAPPGAVVVQLPEPTERHNRAIGAPAWIVRREDRDSVRVFGVGDPGEHRQIAAAHLAAAVWLEQPLDHGHVFPCTGGWVGSCRCVPQLIREATPAPESGGQQ